MRIVVEGPDGSGKSTLVQALSKGLGLHVKSGEGPEKYPGEMVDRVNRYLNDHNRQNHIFDRHPCVSHQIYCQFTPPSPLPLPLVTKFYELPSIFVYCRGHHTLVHTLKGYDTPEHQRALKEHHLNICALYDEWALRRADIIYDFKRSHPTTVLNMLKGLIHV